jgi:hypothetical protein
MAPWITISSLHTLFTIQMGYIFTFVWYAAKQGNTQRSTLLFANVTVHFAARWTNTSAADVAGQWKLWRLSSLVTFTAAEHGLPTKLGWGFSVKFHSKRISVGIFCPTVSVFLVQSQGTRPLCWAVLYRMNLFYVCFSHQSLRDENKLFTNILCPNPSSLQIKCLTIGVCCSHVISWGGGGGESSHKYTLDHMYTLIRHTLCRFWYWKVFYCLNLTLPLNFTINSSTAKCSEEL